MALAARVLKRFLTAVLSVGVALSPFPPSLLQLTHAGSISSASVTPADVTKSASTTYTIVFTPATAITTPGTLSVNFQAPPDSLFGIGAAEVATGSSSVFASIQDRNTQFGNLNVSFTSLPASSVTLKLSSIQNPAKESRYTVDLRTFSSQGQVDQGTATVTIGTVGLQGFVRLPSGTGAIGAWVSAVEMNGAQPNYDKQFGSSTGQDGSYAIGGLTSGKSYSVTIFIGGEQMDPNANTKGFVSPDAVTVTYAGTTLTQNFTLKAATKTVSGTMTRSNGQPVSGGRIFISRRDVFTGGTQATTDSNGRYSASISGGKYEVRPDTWAQPGQAAPDYSYSGPGITVSFAEDDTVETKTGVDFSVVTATATIKGAVTPDPGGFAGIGVFSQGGPGLFTGIQNGTFSLKVPAGTYQLEFGMDPSRSGDKYALPEMAPIVIGENETKDVGTISLVKMDKTISATVRDKDSKTGISDFTVGCFKPRGGGFAMGQTNDSGVATVKVTEGEWGCMAMAGFGTEGGKGMGLRGLFELANKVYAAELGGSTKYVVQGGPKFVKVTSGTAATITFDAVKADRTITVTVTDTSGNPLSEHGFVEASLVSSSAGSDFDGGGLGSPIDPNQPGVATLSVPAGIYELRMMTPPGSDYSSGDPVKVDVTSADKSATLKLLKNDATVRGTLKDEDGNTVKGIFAFVTGTNKKGAFIPGDVNTADGTYSMRVPSAGGELNLGYFVDPSTGYFPQPFGDDSVTPKSGETATKDITMRKATVTINLTVKDPDGNAVKGAFVEADNRKATAGTKIDGFFHMGEESDSDGKVTLKVPAGDFTFRAFLSPETLNDKKWLPPKGENVSLAKNETKSITLTFQKADVTLKGKVSNSSGSAVADAFVTVYSDTGETITTTTNSSGDYSVNIAKGSGWHVVAEKDDSSGKNPLLSSDVAFDTGSETTITKNLTLEDQGTLSTTVSSTFDTDNAKVVSVSDGDLKGAQVSMPADALDTDTQGSNATVNVSTTVEVPRELTDKPLGNIALDVTAQSSSGSSISSLTTSSVSITIPVEQGDLTSAGFTADDVGKSVTMSYYDESNGKWTGLDGSVTATLKDNTGDGDTSDSTDLVLVTGSTDHFTTFAVTAATDTTPPSAPTSITAEDAKTGGAVKLGWTNSTDSDFAKIKVYRSTTEGTVGSAITTIDSKTVTSYTDSSLDNGTKYYYVVRALDSSANESTNTTQVSATPSASATLPKTGSSSLVWLWLTLGALGLIGAFQLRRVALRAR